MSVVPDDVRERAEDALEWAAERSRLSARARAERLVVSGRSLAQIVLAATAAWIVSTELLDHFRPFFAPVSAIVTLGLTVGQRTRRAMEIGVGVTLGIFVGDLMVLWLGTGPAQLALVLASAMVLALLLGSGPLFVQQAAVSAALVVTIQPPDGGFEFSRSLDAMVGTSLALLVHLLVLPTDPLKGVRRAAGPLLDELAATLLDIAAAIDRRDLRATEAALVRARHMDERTSAFAEAVVAGRETASISPPRRRARAPLLAYADAAAQIDLAIRNTRVLARGAMRAVRFDETTPPDLGDAIRDLAEAARALGPAIGDPGRAPLVRSPALRAAARATHALEQTGNLSVATIVSQVRFTAVDLLRSTGLTFDEAVAAIRAAVREHEAELEEAP